MKDEFDDDQEAGGRNGPSLFLVLIAVVAAIAAVFVVQNGDRATIRFLVFDSEVRVWVALAVALVLGALLDRLVIMWRRRVRRSRAE